MSSGPSTPARLRSDCKRCARQWDTCLVVDEQQVVLGRLGRRALVRPNVTVEAMLEAMRQQNLSNVVVTRLNGVLWGLLRREDDERVVASAAVLPPAADGDTV